MSEKIELMPCPFCGSHDVEVQGKPAILDSLDSVLCNECTADAPYPVWNTRALLSQPAADCGLEVVASLHQHFDGRKRIQFSDGVYDQDAGWGAHVDQLIRKSDADALQSELNEARTSIAHLLIELVAVPKWISVEDRLPERVVLAYYENSYNKSRIIRAQYVKKFTQESENIDDFDAQYDEETDTYYDAEGWYEMIDNWGDYSSVAVTEGAITHWMPLPAPHVSLTDEAVKHERP